MPPTKNCLFVVAPDVVGNGDETYALWKEWRRSLRDWPLAYVSQDGDTRTPREADTIFIGGTNAWKDSREVLTHVSKCVAKSLNVHVGRVNHLERYLAFEKAGAHSADGSGVSRYDHMWSKMWATYA